MSSYVTSPFLLEEHRLQEIVNKCSKDLDIALHHVMDQMNLMKQKVEEQNMRDKSYMDSHVISVGEYKKDILERNEELSRRKEHLKEKLQNMQIELSIFQNSYSEMEAAIERQKQLWFRLENSNGNLDGLEESIAIHVQTTESEIKHLSSQKQSALSQQFNNGTINRRKKGISLHMGEQDTFDVIREKSPLDIFIHKLSMALESQYSNRFPSLIQLEKDFKLQPEYAKVAFAVNNMIKVDEIIKQLEAISDSGKIARDKREKAILQYRAICNLMQTAVEEQLIEDERSTRRLIQLYNELFKQYQERQKHDYVSSAISNIMERHGILYQDSLLSANGSTMRFSMDNASVDVSGTENNHLVMEVIGEYNGEAPTLAERGKSVSSAQHLCSLLKTIEAELKAEYGIIFGDIITERPSEESITMERVSSETKNKKYWERKNQKLDSV